MELIFYFSTLLLAVASIAMLVGLILRTEKMLDTAAKLLFLAAFIFAGKMCYEILVFTGVLPPKDLAPYVDGAFMILFTMAILEMHRLVERMGNKKKN